MFLPENFRRTISSPGLLTRRVEDEATLVVVEGTGSFGAIVTERLQRAGHHVVEAARMPAGDGPAPFRADG